MYCPFCGYELPDEARFCQHCGKRMPEYDRTYSQPVDEPVDASSISPDDTPLENPVDASSISLDDTPPENPVDTSPIGTINVSAILEKFKDANKETESPSPDTEPRYQSEVIDVSQISVSNAVEGDTDAERQHNRNVGIAILSVSGILLLVLCLMLVGLGSLGALDDSSNSGDGRVPVLVSSNPTGADVYIGGVYKGSTPVTLQLMPDTSYMIVVKKNGYEQWAKSINPGDGSNPTSVHVSLTPDIDIGFISPSMADTSSDTTISNTIDRQYDWSYGGYSWTTDLSISKNTYTKYKSMSRSTDLRTYVTNSENSALVKDVADSILEAGLDAGFSKDQCVLMAVSFVQSIPYKTDIVSTGRNEYYKYPVETLVDGCGDCEDTAILTAAIVKEMGYGVVLLLFDDHVAVGIKGGDNIYGTYWTYNGDKYFYLETTGTGWDIGEIPAEYEHEKARVIPVN